MSRKQLSVMIVFVLAVLSLGVLAASAQADDVRALIQQHSSDWNFRTMLVEVAEDGNRFVFDDLNLFEDGMPGYGSAFVTQGYIYPAGTLSGSDGVLPNGEPEFPNLVMGEWTCFGWMIGDGARTESGEWVISTQVYRFKDGSTIITDGFEIVDIDEPVTRAITGGTGAHRNIDGEMVQVLRGFTDAMGVNLSVAFKIAVD